MSDGMSGQLSSDCCSVLDRVERIPMQTLEFDKLLARMAEGAEGVSDFLFVAGSSPRKRINGRLIAFDEEPALAGGKLEIFARGIINGDQRLLQELVKSGSCDCSYTVPQVGRFRVNIYRQNGNFGMVLRRLRSRIPSIADLELPLVFNEIVTEKSGLTFVTGGTGSGKTTTIAALLNELNCTEEIHVVTLEDPIEFVHPHHKSTFSQREFGRDFYSFADGLRAALRQAPNVILVGEIRDRETMEVALTAAETGHMVFSTLHTISAAQTINRILGMFSKEEEEQVRHRLADTLRYVVSQRLVPRQTGERMLVTEVMGNSLRTREAIALGENENRRMSDIIESGESSGWHSFEQSLLKAYLNDLISAETALACSSNRLHMSQMIDTARKQRRGYESSTAMRMKVEEQPFTPATVVLKLKPEVPPAPEPAAVAEPLPEPEPVVEPVPDVPPTFQMNCPKCGTTTTLPYELYDLLVECPSCKQEALARPDEVEHPPEPAAPIKMAMAQEVFEAPSF